MPVPADAAASLSALKTAQESFRLAWLYRDDLLRVAVVPVLGSFALDLIDTGARPAASGPAGQRAPSTPLFLPIAVFAAHALLTTVFSVGWLRVLLLPQARGQPELGLRWTRRHGLFFLRSLALMVGVAGLVAGGATLATGLGGPVPSAGGAGLPGLVLAFLLGLASLYLFLRLSLVLPATAVDHPYGFAASWHDTAPAGVQMMLAMMLAGLATAIPVLLFRAIGGIFAASAPLTMVLLDNALGVVISAIFLGVIAIAFRRLAGWREPTAMPAGGG